MINTPYLAAGSFNRRPVQLIDVVPVQVNVIKLVGCDRGQYLSVHEWKSR